MRWLRAAGLLPAALLACGLAAAAGPERVEVPPPPSSPAPLVGHLFRPAGAGPHPAVVMMHGCGGAYTRDGALSSRHAFWGEQLAARGYVALMLDSFTSRGLREICTIRIGSRPILESDRVADANAALAFLRNLPGGRSGRIGLIGWSHGGGYLAFALAENHPAALKVFEAGLVPQMVIALRRLRLGGGTADEVKQALRVELLVDEKRRIADFAGRGELAAWLRVTATRKALKAIRKIDREETLDEILMDHWPNASRGPESKHLRSQYTGELKKAIREAFAALEVRQRNLLRQHILDELTIDDLARLYRVRRAACARWLADAGADLGKHTRKKLVAALGMSQKDEVDSLLRFLDSDIELSISRIAFPGWKDVPTW